MKALCAGEGLSGTRGAESRRALSSVVEAEEDGAYHLSVLTQEPEACVESGPPTRGGADPPRQLDGVGGPRLALPEAKSLRSRDEVQELSSGLCIPCRLGAVDDDSLRGREGPKKQESVVAGHGHLVVYHNSVCPAIAEVRKPQVTPSAWCGTGYRLPTCWRPHRPTACGRAHRPTQGCAFKRKPAGG